jgi:hypothetical protein
VIEEAVKISPGEVVLCREVSEEGAAADARFSGNLINRCFIESSLDKKLQRDLAELTVSGDVSPARTSGRRRDCIHRDPPFIAASYSHYIHVFIFGTECH